MTIGEITEKQYRISEEILDLQDIVLEETIPQEERSFFVGVQWHSEEAVEAAKKRIAELEQELEKLGEKENLARARGGSF